MAFIKYIEFLKLIKSRIRSIIILLFVTVVLSTCLKITSESPMFYKQAEIGRDFVVKLEYPIPESIALKTSCYGVEYRNDTIIKVKYLEYGEVTNSNLSDELSLTFHGPIAEMRIEYNGQYEKRTFFDEDGKPAPNFGCYSQRLKIENGRYITIFNYDKNDKMANDFNNIAQINIKYFDDIFLFSYYFKLRNFRQTTWGSAFHVARSYSDKNGKPVINKYGFISDLLIYDPTNENEFVSKWLYPDNSSYMNSITYNESNDNGTVIRIMHINNKSNELISDITGSIQLDVYDEYGNILERKFLDEKGKLVPELFGEVIVVPFQKFVYDTNLNLVEKQYLGRDEQLVTKGTAIRQYIRDTTGRVIQELNLNYKREPIK